MLDGGNLLHKIPWTAGFMTYGRHSDVNVQFVSQHKSLVVLFDGYPEYSRKDECHLRS